MAEAPLGCIRFGLPAARAPGQEHRAELRAKRVEVADRQAGISG